MDRLAHDSDLFLCVLDYVDLPTLLNVCATNHHIRGLVQSRQNQLSQNIADVSYAKTYERLRKDKIMLPSGLPLLKRLHRFAVTINFATSLRDAYMRLLDLGKTHKYMARHFSCFRKLESRLEDGLFTAWTLAEVVNENAPDDMSNKAEQYVSTLAFSQLLNYRIMHVLRKQTIRPLVSALVGVGAFGGQDYRNEKRVEDWASSYVLRNFDKAGAQIGRFEFPDLGVYHHMANQFTQAESQDAVEAETLLARRLTDLVDARYNAGLNGTSRADAQELRRFNQENLKCRAAVEKVCGNGDRWDRYMKVLQQPLFNRSLTPRRRKERQRSS